MLLGQYRPLNSWLHRLDARSKLIPVVFILVLSLLTDSFLFYIIIQILLITGLLLSGIDSKTIYYNFKPILILMGRTSVCHIIFSGQDSEILVQFWIITIREAAIYKAVFYSLRLMIFISIAFLVTLTCSPSELAEAATKILKPLEKMKLPVGDFSLILFIAIRFIPILYNEFNAIKNAQIIRGVNFTGSLINRTKKITSIIIPVFVSAIQRADDLAMALQVRGYRSDRQRTYYSKMKFGLNGWIFGLGSSTFIFGVFYYLK